MASGDKYQVTNDSTETDILTYFPVGTVLHTYTSTNPSTYIGGTWSRISQGRVLIGMGTGTDTNSVTKSVTSVGNQSGEEYEHTQTLSELYPHYHRMMSYTASGVEGTSSTSSSADRVTYNSDGKSYTSYTYYRGGNGNGTSTARGDSDLKDNTAMNVTQPTYGVYIWRRTN